MRLILRILSFFLVIAAVVVAVFDCVQSFAAGSVVLTPLRTTWAMVNQRGAEAVENVLLGLFSSLQWGGVVEWVFGQPAVIDLLVLSLLCWMAGYKRPRFAGRFAA